MAQDQTTAGDEVMAATLKLYNRSLQRYIRDMRATGATDTQIVDSLLRWPNGL